MSNRFIDNVTPLNAETLNGLEEDLKRYFSLPVYEAKYEEKDSTWIKYRISEIDWKDIAVGSIFAVNLDATPQYDSNETGIFGLRFGKTELSTRNVFYCDQENVSKMPLVYIKNLSANRLYLLIKMVENNLSTPMIGMIDHIDTSKFGSTVQVTNGKINLKNICGAVISSADLPYGVEGAEVPKASQTEFGTSKIWLTGTTLNISTK